MTKQLRVKLVSKNRIDPEHFTRIPHRYEHVKWDLDPDSRRYDWLVVYDDLPASGQERLTLNREQLACPREQTTLVTYEPSSIKYYGTDYVRQFGSVLTSQSPSALAHPVREFCPPVGFWYYGAAEDVERLSTPPSKTQLVSTFASSKRMTQSLHAARFDFLQAVTTGLADVLTLFGRPHNPVPIKAPALDDYRYHIAVENHVDPHHWTEKLSDCFLGYCLPFYAGCANAAQYFPEDSFIPVDVRDPEAACRRIRQAIEHNEYEQRLPAIVEARRRVLEDYSLPNVLGDHIFRRCQTIPATSAGGSIDSRHLLTRRNPAALLRYTVGKYRSRWQHRRRWAEHLRQNPGQDARTLLTSIQEGA